MRTRTITIAAGVPVADALHRWLTLHRQKVPDGSATAKAIDYSLKRWAALTRFIDNGYLVADNNRIENLIRPIALGRNKANRALMRSPQFSPAVTPNKTRDPATTASHNYSDSRNASRAFGGQYRACLTSGAFRRARERSFIARSASTYM